MRRMACTTVFSCLRLQRNFHLVSLGSRIHYSSIHGQKSLKQNERKTNCCLRPWHFQDIWKNSIRDPRQPGPQGRQRCAMAAPGPRLVDILNPAVRGTGSSSSSTRLCASTGAGGIVDPWHFRVAGRKDDANECPVRSGPGMSCWGSGAWRWPRRLPPRKNENDD